ncbi:MAG TPA: D-glycero-beta-D-manno-heptose 1-phosphate adenylyltransferase [Sphingobacteriaceae bacterium]|nr:D-glycero-beta-D-manno-heptose 1-phosphate adenylyltransferase [Sphingobacteriaceae bacterium]
MRKAELLKNKIVNTDHLKGLIESWKLQHKKIVFTNGCFDLLHLGHIDYLMKAADLGDKLVIGLNSDHSTKCLKGPTRPINNEESRSAILAALFFVDVVVLFDDETPYNLIDLVKPDILVKGSDYHVEDIAGADIVKAEGGEVRLIDFLPGYSTTAIEKKIKNS